MFAKFEVKRGLMPLSLATQAFQAVKNLPLAEVEASVQGSTSMIQGETYCFRLWNVTQLLPEAKDWCNSLALNSPMNKIGLSYAFGHVTFFDHFDSHGIGLSCPAGFEGWPRGFRYKILLSLIGESGLSAKPVRVGVQRVEEWRQVTYRKAKSTKPTIPIWLDVGDVLILDDDIEFEIPPAFCKETQGLLTLVWSSDENEEAETMYQRLSKGWALSKMASVVRNLADESSLTA